MNGKLHDIKMNDGSIGELTDLKNHKIFNSPDYKFYFDKQTGQFLRWGATKEDDGINALGLPEICDMEISTVCHGPLGIPCPFCYKSNTGKGENMSFEMFKKVFHKLPPTVTQIAFGIGDLPTRKFFRRKK